MPEHVILNRQNNFDAHILTLVHDLAVNEYLVSSNSVPHSVRWICAGSNLDLPPLTVCWYQVPLRGELLELFVNTLFLDTSFALD